MCTHTHTCIHVLYLFQRVPDVEQISSQLQQLWALAEEASSVQTNQSLGRFQAGLDGAICVCVWCISVCIYERVNVCVCAFILPCSYPDMLAAFNFLAKCTLTSFIDYVMVFKFFFSD